MKQRVLIMIAAVVTALFQMAEAKSIERTDFVQPTLLAFDGGSRFVGSPTCSDLWLSESVGIPVLRGN